MNNSLCCTITSLFTVQCSRDVPEAPKCYGVWYIPMPGFGSDQRCQYMFYGSATASSMQRIARAPGGHSVVMLTWIETRIATGVLLRPSTSCSLVAQHVMDVLVWRWPPVSSHTSPPCNVMPITTERQNNGQAGPARHPAGMVGTHHQARHRATRTYFRATIEAPMGWATNTGYCCPTPSPSPVPTASSPNPCKPPATPLFGPPSSHGKAPSRAPIDYPSTSNLHAPSHTS